MRNKTGIWYFLFGFALGVIASVLYLFFGAWEWFYPKPEWAQIVFAPAMFVGIIVFASLHDINPSISRDLAILISHVFAVLAMGIVYGLLMTVAFKVKRKIETRRSASA